MQKLLISIRGSVEAIEAAKGKAHIADVEYPASALGTPYPLNVLAVRNRLNKAGFKRIAVSTNIGEKQSDYASSCQSALGVATAGADIIKFGLAELSYMAAVYQGESIVRTVKKHYPRKKLIPAVFVDKHMQRFFNPFKEGKKLIKKINADGLLIDTFNKLTGKGLVNYCSIRSIKHLASECHKIKKEIWIAGSITIDELPKLWETGIDVICIRGAACEKNNKGRFGEVKANIVSTLVATIPKKGT